MGMPERGYDSFTYLPLIEPQIFGDEVYHPELKVVGEDPGLNLSRPTARHINSKVSVAGENEYIDLGELGEHKAKDTRYRDSAKEGFMTAYVRSREFVSEHETATKITISTIAIGAVLTGVATLKHRKKL